MKRKLLSSLGLCKKAGMLVEGFDPVAESARGGKTDLILTACDLSPKSEKEVAYLAGKHKIEHMKMSITMDEIWSGLGRRSGILAVANPGFAKAIRQTVSQANEED